MTTPDEKLLSELEALREENRFLRAQQDRNIIAQRLSSSGLWDYDLTTNEAWWSESFYLMLGLDPSLPASPELFDGLVHPSSRHEIRLLTAAIGGSEDSWRGELRLKLAGGRELRVADRCVILRDASGRPLRVVGLLIDITERRALEEQVLMAARTESLGSLSGGIAHDFNNLLTIIFGHVELLSLELPESDPRAEHVETIMAAARQGARLTEQLLAFARKRILQPRVVQIPALVERCTVLLRSLLRESVELRVALAPDLWPVWIESNQLEQVLLNLAANARDAMPRGGVFSIVGVNRADEGGESVHLQVRDTGSGIPAEILSRVFEPFFTTKSIGKGTGLGLATSHGIIAQSGGSLQVSSEEGVGTTFDILLPRCADAVIEAQAALRSTAAARQVPGKRTLLLVEDELMIRELAKTFLEREGYQVMVASDGVEALKLVSVLSEPVDLMITDIVMPKLGGIALAELLWEKWPELPVIFTSGYPEELDQSAFSERVGVHYLAKPFVSAELLKNVEEVLAPAQ